MITEIYCDKFKDKKITFHKGLNVVLGDDAASNSIGKSTLLLVIDYMLGGNHYQTKEDVIKNVGHHKVGVTFMFGDGVYRFVRDTSRTDTVFVCDEDYNILEGDCEMRLEDYSQFLQSKYNLDVFGCTLRTYIGLFARIYDRGNYDEKNPLHEVSNQPASQCIERLVKLFECYKEIDELKRNEKELKERKEAYDKVIKLNLITSAKNKGEARRLKDKIESLSRDIDTLTVALTSEGPTLETMQLQRVMSIKEDLLRLQEQKSKIDYQIRRYQTNLYETKESKVIDISLLQKFFPGVDVLEVNKINQFHTGLCEIMSDDIKNQIAILQNRYAMLDAEEKKLLSSIKDIVDESNATKLAVQQLSAMNKEMYDLIAATSTFEKNKSYAKEKKDATDLYNASLQIILTDIQQTLNEQIGVFNERLYNKTKKRPLLTLQPTRYIYDCPDDGGTGSRFSSLVMFDLAMHEKTKLPVLIHDSLILKNIEDNAIEEIMRLYASNTSKQIFIAFDKTASYSEATQQIVHEHKVIELSPNGHELFGWSWSRISQE